MRRSLHRIISIILLALLAGACSTQEQPSAVKQDSQSSGELTGEALFNERCRGCHTVLEKGGLVGPNLSIIGRVRSRAYLEQMIRQPSKTFPGSVMPTFDTFSNRQITSLVEFLSNLK